MVEKMTNVMSADEFRTLFAKGGNRVRRGRPVIDDFDMGNQKVRNAQKVYDEQGNKLADSKWEYKVMKMMQKAGLTFELQKKFLLLENTRINNGKAMLRKRTWKPDFVFEDVLIVADAKGFTTDVAKLKVHLFKAVYPQYDVFLIKTIEEVYNFINHIKQLRNEKD